MRRTCTNAHTGHWTFCQTLSAAFIAFALLGVSACGTQTPPANSSATASSSTPASASASAGSTAAASTVIPASTSASASSVTPASNSYTITRITGTPDWSTIPVANIAIQPWGDPVDISAYAQVCYDDTALYVRMWALEANIRAEYSSDDLLGDPYEDSCLEFFFSPVDGDARYINIEINPNCSIEMQIGPSRNDRIRLVQESDILEATPTSIDGGWEIDYKVPFDFIRLLFPDFQPESGTTMRANFYKCGDLTVQKHYLAWNPMTSDKPDFHRPQDFGTLVFG